MDVLVLFVEIICFLCIVLYIGSVLHLAFLCIRAIWRGQPVSSVFVASTPAPPAQQPAPASPVAQLSPAMSEAQLCLQDEKWLEEITRAL